MNPIDASPILPIGEEKPMSEISNTPQQQPSPDSPSPQPESTKQGTIWSARLNLLSSMVGGGALSLPLAFSQSGNALIGPLTLIIIAISAEFSIRSLIDAARFSSLIANNNSNSKLSYESTATTAFGPKSRIVNMMLIPTICFFACVGYAVLIRDLFDPLADHFYPKPVDQKGPTAAQNFTMLAVILLVTPLCTLRTLTALQNVGAASMASITMLAVIIAYRSIQCNISLPWELTRHETPWWKYLNLFPSDMRHYIDAIPLFISSFICHFNVIPVYSEFQNPTPSRVKYLVRSTLFTSTIFYLFIGFLGSMYGNCTPSGNVSGNILLDFDENDPLLMVGRVCLSFTIAFAFPMQVIPARDTILRLLGTFSGHASSQEQNHLSEQVATDERSTYAAEELESSSVIEFMDKYVKDDDLFMMTDHDGDLLEPLLVDPTEEFSVEQSQTAIATPPPKVKEGDLVDNPYARTVTAILFFWTGAGLACLVDSIDIVWDLLGSSLSILIGFIIPDLAFFLLSKRRYYRNGVTRGTRDKCRKIIAVLWLSIYFPVMIISTANSVYNVFFSGGGGD